VYSSRSTSRQQGSAVEQHALLAATLRRLVHVIDITPTYHHHTRSEL